ncbi:MAG: glycosyltransferase [Solirubrobacterales bacterium]
MSAREPSILHVVGLIADRYGGPPRNVRDVTSALTAAGHRVVGLTTDRDGHGRLSDAARRALARDPEWVIARVPTRGPALSPGFAAAARRLVAGADVVHLHGIYSPAAAVAGLIARRAGVPYVLQLHGAATDYDYARKRWKKEPYDVLVQRRLIADAAAVLAMTEMEAEQGKRAFPAATMRIVPPPVVADAAVPGSADGGGHDGRTVGFLARLSEKKGAPILLAAFALIADEFPDARLVVAGPDDEGIGAAMSRDVERLGLGGRVSFPGMVVGREKAEMLAGFDVFALPSADESFGIAVVEAMNAGVPVVITDEVAIAADVVAAEAGLSASRTAEGFAAALARLLGDPAAAAAMGSAGRRLAVERYSRTAAVDALMRVYREAIAPAPIA